MTYDELKKASNEYRLWAFHGAPLQFRQKGSDGNWITKTPTRNHLNSWNEDRSEYRVDPSWSGKPKIGTYNVKTKKLTVHKPRRPAQTAILEHIERGELHPNLYIPTFFNGEELPIPDGVQYAWEVSDYVPPPNHETIDYTLLFD